MQASRFVEPTRALARMGENAVRYAELNHTLPDSAPLTPAQPPRGCKEIDPLGTWDGPTWVALDFRPTPEGVPRAYAYAFDSSGDTFVTRAHGDLDGDGVLSTFEMRGSAKAGEAPRLEPGLYVEAELE
ncbi:MAG: hypothetical protein KIS78_10505 [Labilithrix sp.]|nr:hypothetical protein [Labilithrix sp.]